MDTMRICSGCRKPLAANAPEGLCPECLLKAGLGTGVDIGPDTQSASGRIPFVAPTLEELAKRFPQLEILGLIGQGGMGAVYRARQKQLDRVVALKILPPGIGSDPAFAERFTREARAMARLNHPGVVTLYEFGQADGLFFFLMEFVDGVNLRQLLEGGRLSPREALAIVPQICDALQYAHDQGIVHRDIKPENILLDRQGRVKVADFGLAKLVGAEPLTRPPDTLAPSDGERAGVRGELALTDAGKVMGTPAYMAPEQRQRPTEVDHRADIYSLGVVFYQMLTGELPGPRIEPPSKTVRIDVRLDNVVLRALEEEPRRRYQHASEVKADVETIAGTPGGGAAASGAPLAAAPTLAETRASGPARLSRMAVLGAVWAPFFVFPLLALFVVYVALDGAPPRPEWWQSLLMGVLLPLGMTAPFGTTILGAIALPQIRRSAGRLSGLGLALFDVLCFPLLALDALIVWLLLLIIHEVNEGTVFVSLPFIAALAMVVCVAADVVIVVWAWRAANKPAGAPSEIGVLPTRRAARIGLAVGGLVFLAAVLITLLLPRSYASTVRLQRTLSGAPATAKPPAFEPIFLPPEVEIIRSVRVLSGVVQRLGLEERWGRGDRQGKTIPLADYEALALLRERLDVRATRNPQFWEISFVSEDRLEAAEIANAVAESYRTNATFGRVEIVDPAEPALRPVRPNWSLNLTLGALLSLVLGGAAAGGVRWLGGDRPTGPASPSASRGDVSLGTDEPIQSDEEARVRRQLRLPGAGLLLTGSANLVLLAVTHGSGLWEKIVGVPASDQLFRQPESEPYRLYLLLLVSVAVVVGAWSLLRVKSYPRAMVGAVAGCALPLGGGNLACLPFAIWSLVLLARPEVRRAFTARVRPLGSGALAKWAWAGALLVMPSLLFTWFMLEGHRGFGLDIDADEQFFATLAGFPLNAAIGVLLAWLLLSGQPGAPPPEPVTAGCRWSWLAWIAAALLVVSWPLGGVSAVTLHLLSRESQWNPGAGEAFWTIALLGTAGLTMLAGTAFGFVALRRIRGAGGALRGHSVAMVAAWFWPCLAVAALALILVATLSGSPSTREHQVQKMARLEQARIAAVAEAATAAQRFTFGPVVECALYDPDDDPHNNLLDLDSGRIMDVPGPWPGISASRAEWQTALEGLVGAAEREGMDIGSDASGASFMTFRLALVRVGPDDFDRLTAATVRAHDQLAGRELQNQTLTITNPPATFWFKTSVGATGLLQATGFTETVRAVKLRYKLVLAGTGGSGEQPAQREPADLRAAKARLAELRVSFTDEHPQVKAAIARVQALETR